MACIQETPKRVLQVIIMSGSYAKQNRSPYANVFVNNATQDQPSARVYANTGGRITILGLNEECCANLTTRN